MNYLYEAAPRDGATIGVAMQDILVQQALQTKGVRYDARSFGHIGRATSNVPIHFVWRTSQIRDFSDAKVHSATSGASSVTGSQAYLPRASNLLLGTRWKVISGFGDAKQRQLAMERGEVDAGIAGASLFKKELNDLLSRELVYPIVQYSSFRHALFRDVPTIIELANDEQTRRVLAFLVADVGRSFVTPPGVSPEIIGVLRNSFESMMSDPYFVADAQRLGADLDFMSGADLTAYVEEILNTRPEVIAMAAKLMAAD
jgi:tripartite-type tricarboxylate transporter receptor subunit TctC